MLIENLRFKKAARIYKMLLQKRSDFEYICSPFTENIRLDQMNASIRHFSHSPLLQSASPCRACSERATFSTFSNYLERFSTIQPFADATV
jgi:phage tail sheath gpL-like